ncbi:unnamed protein product [Malus baccata var. baccata]
MTGVNGFRGLMLKMKQFHAVFKFFACDPSRVHRSQFYSDESQVFSFFNCNISCMVPATLKRDNYLIWKAFFDPIFCRYKLIEIVNGFETCPPQFLLDPSGNCTRILIPAFEVRYEKDQNILIQDISYSFFSNRR